MKVNKNLYDAFKAKDARFDGRFFVGINSTGIYCRPVCRAKLPKFENCTFYETAAEAEQAGYRPCLLCRPEIAPSVGMTNSSTELAHQAVKIIEKNFQRGLTIEKIAKQLCCSDRHLRRVFASEYNVSPIQYLQTSRLLFAKNLLTDTEMPVSKVAKASGFGSLRRFNDIFKKQYNLAPTDLRKRKINKKDNNISLALSYRPPYCWNKILNFLADRAIKGVELIKNDAYFRTVQLKNEKGKYINGWVEVKNNSRKNNLSVTMSQSLLSVMPEVMVRLKCLFDLQCDPHVIYETLSSMNDIKPDLCILGTRLPGCFDAFEMATRAVLGQQISVKAANTLASRMVDTYGSPIETGIEGLTHIFPSSENIIALNNDNNIDDHLGILGITSIRAKTIYELACLISEGIIDFDLCIHVEKDIKKLMAIRGIGSWTAQYIAMRAMGWTDAFLETDVGIKKALSQYSTNEMLEIAESWSPWRSYATINLWNSL